MRELNRLKRIVAVRTTQRDISAMRLLEARQKVERARNQLSQAERQLAKASQPVLSGEQLTPLDLERMDAERIAALEEIAAWQASKETAERDEESARSRVEAQHVMLRQSERLEERAEQRHQRRISAVERQQHDERASRSVREPF